MQPNKVVVLNTNEKCVGAIATMKMLHFKAAGGLPLKSREMAQKHEVSRGLLLKQWHSNSLQRVLGCTLHIEKYRVFDTRLHTVAGRPVIIIFSCLP